MIGYSEKIIRRLGRTGFSVNVLGLGGHTYPVGYGLEFFTTPEARAQLIRYLVSSGVNYFDTTWIHEVELLADSFRRADIKEDVVVSLQHTGALNGDDWRHKLRHEIESRLSILGYTRAPLFLLGMGEEMLSYAEVAAACETMARLKEETIVQNIGLSCHTTSLFPLISRVIHETDLLDYIMIRFNWKFQQANEELFPIARDHDVGIVVMKVFCWDCGPGHWERRISIFEPVGHENSSESNSPLTPAQRNLLWCIQNSPCHVVVPSINTMREATENLEALRSIGTQVITGDFETYSKRLWKKREIKRLALNAESNTIREQAEMLLRPRRDMRRLLKRTIEAHYKILTSEGPRQYLLRSYRYRKGQISGWIRNIFCV